LVFDYLPSSEKPDARNRPQHPCPSSGSLRRADPDRIGKIVSRGPEVSEVRFDDGAVRNVVNDHLRTVEVAEVELDNPTLATDPPVHVAVRQGQEAWLRLSSPR
jgi:hypothetical protein